MGDVIHFVVEVASQLPLPLQADGATLMLSVLSVRPIQLCLAVDRTRHGCPWPSRLTAPTSCSACFWYSSACFWHSPDLAQMPVHLALSHVHVPCWLSYTA